MIKHFLQRWLGIQELSDSLALTKARVFEGKPSYPADDPHEPVLVEKPDVIKGYEFWWPTGRWPRFPSYWSRR